jgi:hypothetical protein
MPLNNSISIQHLLQKDEEEAKTIEYMKNKIEEMNREIEELTVLASLKLKAN